MKDHGFEQIEEVGLPEFRARGLWLRHGQTGAEVFHIVTDDRENMFGFAFSTPPPNSTGVAHILEHTVLCGSRRYPLKDPFIMLAKGSLKTFLNAMTAPDFTIYPASSTVERDLFNIMEVYGDAVFFPLLREEFFRQEGHRLQFNGDGALEITGIVYNEMKGVYSSHDSVAARWAHRALLPDTPFGYDSGGDPAVIPDLTYEDFVGFHRTYYHPSNARILLYGDIPTDRYLDLLNRRFLSHFERLDLSIPQARQPRWSEPREHVVGYPAEAEGSPTSITIGWLLEPTDDPIRVMAHELLAYVLLGTSAGPLRKRLIESGLGDDLSAPTGIETDLGELLFNVGLRGVKPNQKDEVEALVLDTLRSVVRDGIDSDIVESAFRKFEFANREIRGGGPNGLRLGRRVLRGWMHGTTPYELLRFERPFNAVRDAAASNRRYFEENAERSLLENPHRVTVTVRPDETMRERDRQAVAARLSEIESTMTAERRAELERRQRELDELQSAPNDPAAVAAVPFLKVSDLPRELEVIPTVEDAVAGVPIYRHDLFANGVLYLELSFDLSGLDAALLPWVPIYVDAVGEVGLPGKPYDVVSTEIALKSGGMSSLVEAGIPLHEVRNADRRVTFRMKALESTFAEAADLLAELLLRSEFTNIDRLAEIMREAKSDLSGSVIPSGHRYAALRAGRALSEADRYEETWGGATQLLFASDVSPKRVREASDACCRINDALIRRGNVVVNVTGTEEAQRRAAPAIERLIAALPEGGWSSGAEQLPEESIPLAESLIVPADVAYVAAACRGARIGSPEYVHEEVLAHVMRTSYLWEAIRMKGGAYGASATARGMDAVFGFWSYRDPNVIPTLRAFETGLDEYAADGIDDDELELAIIGVTGNHIRPLSPGEQSIIGLRRALYGITDELRQENHQTLLATGGRDLQAAAERLRESMRQAHVVVVAGDEKIREAAKELPLLAEHRTVLPV